MRVAPTRAVVLFINTLGTQACQVKRSPDRRTARVMAFTAISSASLLGRRKKKKPKNAIGKALLEQVLNHRNVCHVERTFAKGRVAA